VERHDIAIIGGGIAGLTLSKFLAEYGMDFVLLEEHDGFFKKACGEGITPYIFGYNFFDIYESNAGIERRLNITNIHTRYGDLKLYMPVLMTDKEKIEGELARQARKRGADIRMGEKVKNIRRDGDEFLIEPHGIIAKLLVGADGFFSMVRKLAGIKQPDYAVGVETLVENIDMNRDEVHIEYRNDVIKYGYSWFFPKKEKWNVGIGSFKPHHFKEYFDKFKERIKAERWRGANIPISKPLKSYAKGIMLVGDAASHIISSIGAGNITSMICAKIAADAINKISRNGFNGNDTSIYAEMLKPVVKMMKRDYNFAFVANRIIKSEYIRYRIIKKVVEVNSEYYRKMEERV